MRLPFRQIGFLLENKQYPEIALPREMVRVLLCLVRGCVPFQSNLPVVTRLALLSCSC